MSTPEPDHLLTHAECVEEVEYLTHWVTRVIRLSEESHQIGSGDLRRQLKCLTNLIKDRPSVAEALTRGSA